MGYADWEAARGREASGTDRSAWLGLVTLPPTYVHPLRGSGSADRRTDRLAGRKLYAHVLSNPTRCIICIGTEAASRFVAAGV